MNRDDREPAGRGPRSMKELALGELGRAWMNDGERGVVLLLRTIAEEMNDRDCHGAVLSSGDGRRTCRRRAWLTPSLSIQSADARHPHEECVRELVCETFSLLRRVQSRRGRSGERS